MTRCLLQGKTFAMPSGVPTRAVATAFLRPTIRLRISPSMARALQRHAQAVAAWRFSVSVSRDTLASGDKAQGFLCVVKSVPIVEGVKLSANDLLEFVDSLRGGTDFERFRAPSAASRILASKACRGSIMFGDSLSRSSCVQLVRQLATCRFPFQCAHGRPTVTPMTRWTQLK